MELSTAKSQFGYKDASIVFCENATALKSNSAFSVEIADIAEAAQIIATNRH